MELNQAKCCLGKEHGDGVGVGEWRRFYGKEEDALGWTLLDRIRSDNGEIQRLHFVRQKDVSCGYQRKHRIRQVHPESGPAHT